MSDTTRQLEGLGSLRRVDPKKMVRRNRDTNTPAAEPAPDAAAAVVFAEAPATDIPAAEVAAAAPQQPVDVPERPNRPKSATKTSTARNAAPAAPVKGGQARVNTYIDGDLRSRVVAAFRFTSHLEGESSFSEFVETALLNEAIRREEKYNAGEPYEADVKLPRGRPVRG